MVGLHRPRCHCEKLYRMSTGKRRCSHCRYDFRPHRLPLYPTRDQWKAIIPWFLLEQSGQTIALRTGIDRKRVLRGLTWIRRALARDVPDVFSGTVEVEMTQTWAVTGRTRERQPGTRGPNEEEEDRNNRSSGFSVDMARSGQRLSRMSRRHPSSHSYRAR